MFPFDLNYIIAFIFGILVIFLLFKVLYFPFKMLLRFAGFTLAGGLLLYISNIIGAFWGLTVGINMITAVVAGLLGVPGVVLLFVVQHLSR